MNSSGDMAEVQARPRTERKHPVNNAAREALGGMVGPRLMTKAGLL
jgi:hypothetical protein